jgi:hypothetical protein
LRGGRGGPESTSRGGEEPQKRQRRAEGTKVGTITGRQAGHRIMSFHGVAGKWMVGPAWDVLVRAVGTVVGVR